MEKFESTIKEENRCIRFHSPVHTLRKYRSTTRNWRRPRWSIDWQLAHRHMACGHTGMDIWLEVVWSVEGLASVSEIRFPISSFPPSVFFAVRIHLDSTDPEDSSLPCLFCSHLSSRNSNLSNVYNSNFSNVLNIFECVYIWMNFIHSFYSG